MNSKERVPIFHTIPITVTKRVFKEPCNEEVNENDHRFVPDFWRKRCTCTLGRGWSSWPPGTMATSIPEARLCPDQRVTFVHPRERGSPLNTARSSSRIRTYIRTYPTNCTHKVRTNREKNQATIEPSRWTVPNDLRLRTHAGHEWWNGKGAHGPARRLTITNANGRVNLLLLIDWPLVAGWVVGYARREESRQGQKEIRTKRKNWTWYTGGGRRGKASFRGVYRGQVNKPLSSIGNWGER